MNFKGIRLNIVIVIIALVIILFFSGQYLFKLYGVNRPIKEEIMAIDGVAGLDILNENNSTDILISFDDNINFHETYKKIRKITNDKLGNETGKIIIKNDNIEKLENVFYELHYAIYEGIATNKFVMMNENVKNITDKNNINDFKLWIDNDAVYLQLNNDNKSLYRRIPYSGINKNLNKGGGTSG